LVKDLVDRLNEDLEEANYYKNTYKSELDQLTSKFEDQKNELHKMKSALIELG